MKMIDLLKIAAYMLFPAAMFSGCNEDEVGPDYPAPQPVTKIGKAIVEKTSLIASLSTDVAGNTDALGYPDLVVTSGNNGTSNLPATLAYSVNGSVVYGANGTVVSGSTFDFATMLSALNDGVRALTGSDNPALTGGMAASALVGITTGMNPEVDVDKLAVDQKGNDRTDSAMGAYVGN